MKGMIMGGVVWLVVLSMAGPAGATVWISEFLADPPNGLAGDANQDGVRSASEDEFVEIFNSGSSFVSLSNWSLSDGSSVRHIFPEGFGLSGGELAVVFGGGSPSLLGVKTLTASTGRLSLNNGGDTLRLRNDLDQLIQEVIFGPEGGDNESLARFPEGTGDVWVKHRQLPGAGDRLFSPGVFVGTIAAEPGSHAVPEPAGFWLMALGGWRLWRRRT